MFVHHRITSSIKFTGTHCLLPLGEKKHYETEVSYPRTQSSAQAISWTWSARSGITLLIRSLCLPGYKGPHYPRWVSKLLRWVQVFNFLLHLLKELCHDILSRFINGLNHHPNVGKPKSNSLLRKKNSKGVILKEKGTRIAEDGEDWNGLEALCATLAQKD